MIFVYIFGGCLVGHALYDAAKLARRHYRRTKRLNRELTR